MDFSVISSPIRTFQSMIQCAISTSECIPKEDLLVAFKTSLDLLERIGELMHHNLIVHSKLSNDLNYNIPNVGNNSFLNSYTNHYNDTTFYSQSSPPLSGRDSIPVSRILPISSSQTIATVNNLLKNGIISNNENLPDSRSHSADNTSGRGSDNSQDRSASKHTVWHNRSRSPVSSLARLAPSPVPTDLSKPSRKTMNSDELNRLLDSCEVKPAGDIGASASCKKNYKCKFCGKMYDIKSSIRYHVRIIHLKMHLKAADMQCKLCGRVFTCATATNKHQSRCLKAVGPDVR